MITPAIPYYIKLLKNNVSYCNKIPQKQIRNAKKTYYYSCFTKYINDLVSTWITIKYILNKQNKNKHYFPEHFQMDENNISDKRRLQKRFNVLIYF